MRTIAIEEFQAALAGQGVGRDHAAFVCPICRTVQSMASLKIAGAEDGHAESAVGFSCEGRLTKAGAWPSASSTSAEAVARRAVRGCDWTLGGLFRLHELEVRTPDDKLHPTFEVASPAEAQNLKAQMEARNAAVV